MDLQMDRGTTPVWTVAVTVGGLAVDLTGATITFTAQRSYSNPIVFQRTSAGGGGILLDPDPTTGVCYVKPHVLDTSGLANECITLVYSLVVLLADGTQLVPAKGKLLVNPVAGI